MIAEDRQALANVGKVVLFGVAITIALVVLSSLLI